MQVNLLSLKFYVMTVTSVSEPGRLFGSHENATKFSGTKTILNLLPWQVHFENF